jgi:hypothetical protein
MKVELDTYSCFDGEPPTRDQSSLIVRPPFDQGIGDTIV